MPRHELLLRVVALSLAPAILFPATAGSQEPLFRPNQDLRAPARLTVAMTADPVAIVPGRPVTLHIDMTPAQGIHVYAPGNAYYIPVSVTLTPPAGVQVQPPIYPPGQDYVFGELKEMVKVYSRPFQVRQSVVVTRAAAKAGSITLAGAVRYQACDDKVCFPPATTPVSLTLPIAAGASRGPSH